MICYSAVVIIQILTVVGGGSAGMAMRANRPADGIWLAYSLLLRYHLST